MIPLLNVLQYVLLSLWVGAMFAFGALYAPVLFRSLSSRDQAGAIAGETLARIDALGLVTGGIMAVITVLQTIDAGWQALDLGRLLTAALMLALVVFSSVTVRQRLNAIRQQIGRPIDELPQDDPQRVEYGKQHRLSRLIFSVNMFLGALLIVLSALRPV